MFTIYGMLACLLGRSVETCSHFFPFPISFLLSLNLLVRTHSFWGSNRPMKMHVFCTTWTKLQNKHDKNVCAFVCVDVEATAWSAGCCCIRSCCENKNYGQNVCETFIWQVSGVKWFRVYIAILFEVYYMRGKKSEQKNTHTHYLLVFYKIVNVCLMVWSIEWMAVVTDFGSVFHHFMSFCFFFRDIGSIAATHTLEVQLLLFAHLVFLFFFFYEKIYIVDQVIRWCWLFRQ